MDNNVKRILLIEDEKPLSMALKRKLENDGFVVDTAFDGVEGLRRIQENEYALVLLDLVMPNLDGFGVLSAVKASNKHIKIIVSSNLGQQEDIQKAKALGAIDYFIKIEHPLSDIVAIVKKYTSG